MKKHTPIEVTNKCNLTVYEHIQKGVMPSKIIKFNVLSKRQCYYSVKQLLSQGIIKKITRGVYEVTSTHHVGMPHTPMKVTKRVRCHGVTATLKIKRLTGWERRAVIMKKSGIEFKEIPQGQQIILDDVKIWLTNKSIVFYLPYSWFDETARKAAQKAVNYLILLIQSLEKKLKVTSFKINKRYHIKFSRQHYALIRNELARQYNLEKKKLFVYDEKGLWLLIDNSLNLHELETVHPISAIPDNERVDEAFNSIKQGVTPQFLMDSIAQVVENQAYHERNIKTHISAIQELAKAVKELKGAVRK